MHRYRLLVEGSVQGVGFRWFAKRLAERFCLTGWVENCEDGRVALEVQGQDAALCDFLELLAAGRAFIEVETIHKKELPLCDETRFIIQ